MESPDFLELFVSEAREHIEGQGALLLRARSATLESAEINDLFRHAHSIKGMAAAMGFTPMTALAHAMEDLLHHWRDGALAPNPGSIDLLMRANDCLSAQLDAVVAGTDLPSGDAIRETLRALSPASLWTVGLPPLDWLNLPWSIFPTTLYHPFGIYFPCEADFALILPPLYASRTLQVMR